MKAYNETLLRNQYAQEVVQRLNKEGKLNEVQCLALQKLHADVPYNPNIFIKLLLFLFGCLGFGLGGSLMTVFIIGFDESFWGFSVVSAIYGAGATFLLLFLIRERKLYFSGIDNALIYCILGALMPLVYQIYDTTHLDEPWLAALLFLPLLLLTTYVFGEPVVALFAFLTTLFIGASLLMKHPLGKALLPFALMIGAAIAYSLGRRFGQKKASFYWAIALEWTSTMAMVVFYAAGNYYVVREANAALNHLPPPAPEIAFAPIFWGLTFVIPLLYLYLGFRWRNRLVLLLGLLGVVASVMTYRFYHAVLPTEWGLVLGGLVAVAVAVWVIRQLKTPRFGFSNWSEEDKKIGLETIILSQMTQNIQTTDPSLQLGGGDFGGGGAGEQY
ncbi:MAG: hypothetical protein R2822_10515 [Spirosomataceae bacterium]